MIIIRNDCTDPYFNMACEEYFINNSDKEIFMLWRNSPAVIIGRNQNAYAEINREYTEKHNIPVVRRLSGGGAVFHDLGNVNFTHIISDKDCGALDFPRFMNPVIEALGELGVNAVISGRNDITVDNKKISGNAQCVMNSRIMHHGTLLFSADLSGLTSALNAAPEKTESKGIKSIRSRVSNICEFLKRPMDVLEFRDHIYNYFSGERRGLSEDEIEKITLLRNEKYSKWEWNFGHSKEYTHTVRKHFPFGLIECSVNVNRGIITDINISGDYFGVKSISDIESKITGTAFERKALEPLLDDIGLYITGAEKDEILSFILGAE